MGMQNKDVTITITEYRTGLKISVSEEPVNLHDLNSGGDVNWILDNDSVSLGWAFDSATGIVIKNNSRHKFKKKGSSSGKKQFTWIRKAPDAPGSYHYDYTISVAKGGKTVSWDPSIINQP